MITITFMGELITENVTYLSGSHDYSYSVDSGKWSLTNEDLAALVSQLPATKILRMYTIDEIIDDLTSRDVFGDNIDAILAKIPVNYLLDFLVDNQQENLITLRELLGY